MVHVSPRPNDTFNAKKNHIYIYIITKNYFNFHRKGNKTTSKKRHN